MFANASNFAFFVYFNVVFFKIAAPDGATGHLTTVLTLKITELRYYFYYFYRSVLRDLSKNSPDSCSAVQYTAVQKIREAP